MHALLLSVTLGACAAPPPQGSAPRHATELTGRTAGAPQRCVQMVPSEGLRIADGDRHTLLFGHGKTVWANDLGPSCGFGSNDVLVVEPLGSSYCRGDLVRSFDSFTEIPGPACILGDFVPFTRAV
jgi:hypothetical protein